MSDLKVGTRIKFLRTLSSGPNEHSPGNLYAQKDEFGEITEIGNCKEGYWVKTDNWSAPFGCRREEFVALSVKPI